MAIVPQGRSRIKGGACIRFRVGRIEEPEREAGHGGENDRSRNAPRRCAFRLCPAYFRSPRGPPKWRWMSHPTVNAAPLSSASPSAGAVLSP